MEGKIISFYILFTNAIHLVENTCKKQEVKSKFGKTFCEDYYDECKMVYPIVEKIISCSDMSISNIISNVGAESYGDVNIILKVTDSDIAVLPTSIFKNLKKLTIIYLENSNIEKIIPGAFNFLDNLKELYLDGNQLTTISDGLFNSLTLLEKLDLSRNQIQDITVHAFQGVKLIELHLTNNNISQIGQELLDSLTSIKTLDISLNNLNNITSFNTLPLSNLNLSHNTINIVDFEFFPETLSKIDLSFNSLSEIINFNACRASEIILNNNNIGYLEMNLNAEVLDVSYNNLETVGSSLFGGNLKKLKASHNLISSLNKDAFLGLYNLKYLLLNNNSLSSVPNSCFNDLKSLTYLDLSRNKLSHFAFGTFENLLNLTVLNISYNNLKDLQQYTFYPLSSLTDLYFQNNEISEIHVVNLKIHVPKLKTVNLDNNNWSCKKLLDILHNLKKVGVSVTNGNCLEVSNIHGIKCYEILNGTELAKSSESENDFNSSKLNQFFNKNFTKTVIYKYSNEDSNFLKSLEILIHNMSNDAQSLNANYFKFINEFKINYSNVYNETLTQSIKYLESLKNQIKIEKKFTDSKVEVSSPKVGEASGCNSNYCTALLLFISTILVVILCVMMISSYLLISRSKIYHPPIKEEVQLL